MGKWSNVTLPEGLEERFNELRACPISDIDGLWTTHGSLSLGDFANMQWYWSSLNGWACIDNCDGPNSPANFKVFVAYEIYANDGARIRTEKIAVILASEFNMPRKSYELKSKDSNTIDAVFKVLSNIDSTHRAYNDPADEQFIKDYLKIHSLCRDLRLGHKLTYLDSSDLWFMDISNENNAKYFESGAGCLSVVMGTTVQFLGELVRNKL